MFVGVIVTPFGAPVIAAVGVPVKPPVAVTVAVTVVELPCATVALVGLREIVMAGVGVVLPPSSLDPHARANTARPVSITDARRNRLGYRVIRNSFGL